MDTEYFAQRLQQCSRTEKQESMKVVQDLLAIAFYAREHTLVELDKYVRNPANGLTDPYLQKAVACLIDLPNADLIKKVLENYMISGNYTGQLFLKSLLISETMQALSRKDDIDHIFSFLIPSLCGLEFEQTIEVMYRDYIKNRGFRAAAESAEEN